MQDEDQDQKRADQERNSDEQSTRRRANLLRMKYFDTRTLHKLPAFKGVLTNKEMYDMHAVVLSQEQGTMIIAVTSDSPQHALNNLRKRYKDYRLSFVLISESGFKEFMLMYDPPKKIDYGDIRIVDGDNLEEVQAISKTLDEVRSDDIFNYLLRQAMRLNASDIHLETQEEDVRIRFRVDGVLHIIATITNDKYRQLSSTIAIAANISTAAPDPQTGHMHHRLTDDDKKYIDTINTRIETVPTSFGQDVVIRLFTVDRSLFQLKRLGLSEDEKAMIDEIIAHPRGMVMAVGPTGSGKTTTLYSILGQLNTVERKIITLEDPVEYNFPGVTQIPVNTDQEVMFSERLRAVLRLDPDIIMVGEIRDADSARTALQAALSGHLVLSTFHATNTTAALSRLYDFLGDNPLLTSAIRLVVAQRLVRVLDPKTRQPDQPSEKMMSVVRDELAKLPEEVRPNLDEVQFYKPGKSKDAPFGYVGQTAVVEMLHITPEIERLLHQSGTVLDTFKVRDEAMKTGMMTLTQDALLKAVAGETSLEEVFRVVG